MGYPLFKSLSTDKRQNQEIAELRTNIAQQAKRMDYFVLHQSFVGKIFGNVLL